MRDALRMAHGVLDADRTALRDAEEREALDADCVDYCFQIRDLRRQPKVGDLPVGQPAAPRIVANELPATRKVAEPVAPDRALPVEFEVRQPVRSLDERRTGAGYGVGEPDTVGGLEEPDRLFHLRI